MKTRLGVTEATIGDGVKHRANRCRLERSPPRRVQRSNCTLSLDLSGGGSPARNRPIMLKMCGRLAVWALIGPLYMGAIFRAGGNRARHTIPIGAVVDARFDC